MLRVFLHIIDCRYFVEQPHFDTWGVNYGDHSVQDGKLSSVSGHSILFVYNSKSLPDKTVEKAAFATIGKADQ